nr:reverse transcriptase domain-containing protein [Tanacetum cinerariifolium]
FFIIFSIAVQTPDSGISNLVEVGTTFTGSGNLYCQWELSPGSGNALCFLLPTKVRRFQELAVLCPNMVPNNKKLMEVFIGGLARSIKGNVTASKPQTLEEAINIA